MAPFVKQSLHQSRMETDAPQSVGVVCFLKMKMSQSDGKVPLLRNFLSMLVLKRNLKDQGCTGDDV